ncbi:MAG: hypothetical protein UX47_C0006G0052 [Candidatus Collierbacteria bacterium GW2011_GWA2_46_26]|uniref:Uncharacterized protein n=1 Tax=Candidatus Collierbacteria bacterium GW2011_GWA2_46_26 TaxID=1618381 RepID=A0A0G1PK07_9BACT|nr:MAG: hypothetical protein UX47_C0006G0052 [Candidatus Collierbacteria bacterium GW2011_GWA2_46_26]
MVNYCLFSNGSVILTTSESCSFNFKICIFSAAKSLFRELRGDSAAEEAPTWSLCVWNGRAPIRCPAMRVLPPTTATSPRERPYATHDADGVATPPGIRRAQAPHHKPADQRAPMAKANSHFGVRGPIAPRKPRESGRRAGAEGACTGVYSDAMASSKGRVLASPEFLLSRPSRR